jgi:sigma-B regulation protein RsbU (phosphoserine phosphatase)
MNILVADDDEVSLSVLVDRLEELGYSVTSVTDGGAAWEAIEAGAFRLIILDWVMPVIDGMELVRRIREAPSKAYVYVMLLTGRTDRKDRLEALEGGADDFLPKPLDEAELLARLKAAQRILQSEEALQMTNVALEHSRRSELRTGGYIQQRLLQSPMPKPVSGWQIERLNIASQDVDGDFVECFAFPTGEIDVVAADVMGKGIPAALTGAGVKTSLNRSLIQLLARGGGGLPTPDDILAHLHAAVSPELIELQTFLTLCYARFEGTSGGFTYVNCGHPRPIHWKAIEDEVELLATTALPLGFTDIADYSLEQVQLSPGDLVVLYSDGITDLPIEGGGRLGMNGFGDFLKPLASRPLSEILDAIRELRRTSPESGSVRDDMTVVIARYLGPSPVLDELTMWMTGSGLEQARDYVRARLASSGLDFDRTEQGEVLLAFQEAASNAVRHGRPGASGIPLTVRAYREEDRFRVELAYPGDRFDPKRVPPPTVDGSREGGFGIAIMRRCMNRVAYLVDAGQNLVVMEKVPVRSAGKVEG